MSHVAEDTPYGGGVASQFVGNDSQWFDTLAPQEYLKESFCGPLIPVRLDQDVDHVTVLVHSTPQVMLLAVDSKEHLVQVPVVADLPLVASVSEHNQDRTSHTTAGSSHTTR